MNLNKKNSRFDSLSSNKETNPFLQPKKKSNYNKNFNHSNSLVYNSNQHTQITKQEFNNDEDFPEIMFNVKDSTQENKTINYLDKCKQHKEDEDKYKIKPGWVCIQKDKNMQIQYSVDGKTWVKDMEDLKTDEEKMIEEKNKQIEFNNEINWRLEQLEIEADKQSLQYYLDTGKLDIHAQVKKEREEYDEYCKQFEENEQETEEMESEEEYYSD